MRRLITFGGPHQNYYDAKNRLISQAHKMNIFDSIIGYTDIDIKNDIEFWKKHKDFILSNYRGYGYWIWKSYLILKNILEMKEGDILIYADSGCEFDYLKRKSFDKLFEITNNVKLVYSNTKRPEKLWTKMDLLDHMNMNEEKYYNEYQLQGSVLSIYICNQTLDFVKEWCSLCCNYHLIDDTPSITPNLDCFIEHRHDQSIFSLLVKKYNIGNDSISKYINISRNRTGNSTFVNKSDKIINYIIINNNTFSIL